MNNTTEDTQVDQDDSLLVPYTMYVIKWRDHFSTDGFFSKNLEEFDGKALELTSVGFFIKEDDNYYHFARTLGESCCADTMSIIKEQIVELDVIYDGETF